MALRVKLEPDQRRARNGLAVLGATLRLTAFGPKKTAAEKGVAKPATITFCGAYIKEVRKEDNPDLEPFAKLNGTLMLSGPLLAPAMTLDGEAIEHDEAEPTDEDGPLPYELVIGYHSDSFTSPPPSDSALTKLRLPEAPEDVNYFELGIELEIDGAAEAASGVNDRLDVPLATTTFIDVQLKDDKDHPLDEEPYELQLFDGSTLTGVTDDEGRVQVNPVPEGRCILALVKVDQGPLEVPADDSQDA